MATIEAVFQQALAFHQAGLMTPAEQGYRTVLMEQPVHADTLHLLGVLLHQTGRSDRAIAYIEGAIKLEPVAAQYHINLGNVLRDLNRKREAVQCYGKAIRLQPNLAEAHYNLGRAQVDLGEKKDAELSFRRALRANAAHAETHIDLAKLLQETGRPAESLALCEAALRIRPGDPLALNNRGLALVDLGRWLEAADSFSEALQHRPDYNLARFNLGRVLTFHRQSKAAAACFEEILRRAPGDAQAHFSLGELLLLDGEFERGFLEMERGGGVIRPTPVPGQLPWPPATWNGEPVAEGVLVIHADQGFGDAIQACRYIRFCAERATVVVVAPQALLQLFSGLGDCCEVVMDRPASHPVHCPITSLPRILRTTPQTIPNTVPYLHAEAEPVAAWRRRLAPLPGLRVGLVWAGNPNYVVDRRRSIPLESLAALAGIPGVSFVSLQKGEAAKQARKLQPRMRLQDWTGELTDFAATAALIEALDLVIGVDTAVVHLAGALGKPVWLLNRFDTDWRWMFDRDDSLWYPTLRQFRQPKPGDWASVVAEAGAALTALAVGRGASEL
jgi:tetratricopeptide (TPR) repeat protein